MRRVLLLASVAACGGSKSSTVDGAIGADAAAAIDGAARVDAAPGTCPTGGPYGGGEPSIVASSVTAKVVDETGAPVSGQPVYICGIDLCSDPATTKSDGTVTITTTLTERKPAFKVGDTIAYNEIAIPLAAGATDFTKGGTAVLTIGALGNKPGAALTPGTSATSGDVTIAVAAGATVGIDTLVYSTPDEQELRTARIPLTNDAAVLASSGHSDFALFYGLAPAESTICPPAKVTVQLPHATMSPNDFGWAPGTAVEFWIMTTDTAQTYAPYAGWAKASDGVVSSDGTSVSTIDGEGLDFLESFAIRKAS